MSARDRVDAALHGCTSLAAELELELRELESRSAEVRRELARLRAGTRRVFGSDDLPAGDGA